MKKSFDVPKGKNLAAVSVSGHTYVRLLDSNGVEVFRFDSPGEHVTAVVRPGSYTVETDGKVGEVDVTTAERLRDATERNALKPPTLR